MNDRTITAERCEFSIGGQGDDVTHVGLHAVESDGTRTTLALDARDAEAVGRLLIAHCDALNGKPVRDWSQPH
jgi:hypothetical protein